MRRAAITSLAGFAATGASYLFFVCTRTGQQIDAYLTPDRPASSNWLLRAYDRHVLLAEILVAIVVAVIGWRRGQLRRGLLCAMLPAVAAIEADALQAVLHRPVLVDSAHNSFPSGHVALAAATVLALLLVVPRGLRPVLGILGAVAVGAVAIATMYAAWHRASDVVGGLLLACALAAAVVAASPAKDRVGSADDASTEVLIWAG